MHVTDRVLTRRYWPRGVVQSALYVSLVLILRFLYAVSGEVGGLTLTALNPTARHIAWALLIRRLRLLWRSKPQHPHARRPSRVLPVGHEQLPYCKSVRTRVQRSARTCFVTRYRPKAPCTGLRRSAYMQMGERLLVLGCGCALTSALWETVGG